MGSCSAASRAPLLSAPVLGFAMSVCQPSRQAVAWQWRGSSRPQAVASVPPVTTCGGADILLVFLRHVQVLICGIAKQLLARVALLQIYAFAARKRGAENCICVVQV